MANSITEPAYLLSMGTILDSQPLNQYIPSFPP